MNISKDGIVELANYEAMAYTKYIDSGGVQTIGIGMTVSEIKDIKSWAWDATLTTKECVDMFIKALAKYEAAVNKALKVTIPQHQYDVLVSICYNIGTGGMAGSTFMKRINARASDESVCEALKRWNQDNGKVIKGLVNRRAAEAKIFSTGKYTNDGTVGVIRVDSNHKPRYTGGRINILEFI